MVLQGSVGTRLAARLCSRRRLTLHTPPSISVRSSSNLPNPRLDYKSIADNVVYKSTNLLNRKAAAPPDAVQSVVRAYNEHKRISISLNAKRNHRSSIGKKLKEATQTGDNSAKALVFEEAKLLKEDISKLEAELDSVEGELLSTALALPNDTHPSAPLGAEEEAVVLETRGAPCIPADSRRDHVLVGQALGMLDLESGASVTGTSWYYLLNEGALLELALINYAVSVAIQHGFTPVTTPDVVRTDIAMRCGFQPRDYSDPPVHQFYPVGTGSSTSDLILSGTAEIPLAGMFADKIFPSTSLPLKVVGVGKAFRAEAGARGADTRGLYRVHQFSKVELFAVTQAQESEAMMEEMRMLQTTILDGLGLTYRVLDMPTEELGASAYRKFDMEAWMPGRGKWGEVSSLSNCTDFQARRLLTRYSLPKGKSISGNHFAHTLNGTAAAIPRLIVALLENGSMFNEAGEVVGVRLPKSLQPFWPATGTSRSAVQWI